MLKWLALTASIAALAVAVGSYTWIKLSPDYSIYWIRSGSMEPTIRPLSLVVVRKHSYKRLEVITFKVEGQVITHRLRGFRADGTTVTRGDNDPTDDPWHVSQTAIVVHAVAAIYLGRVFGWPGLVLGIGILVLVACWLFWPQDPPRRPVPLVNSGP